ncbi:Cell number regulator 6 [Platanthera guangdongensis]|uniref:Cell number regulator 6 n=1 Tax=Platanthera guangdongensis TaxID=2320717 RepID=A0ABR2MM79_9ASPA
MADQGSTSQYVKLKKIQDAPAEDIQPGELNQPIRVPQLEVPKCDECGQQLPENFQPPADEAWTTNILRCEEDTETLIYLIEGMDELYSIYFAPRQSYPPKSEEKLHEKLIILFRMVAVCSQYQRLQENAPKKISSREMGQTSRRDQIKTTQLHQEVIWWMASTGMLTHMCSEVPDSEEDQTDVNNAGDCRPDFHRHER